MAAMGGSVARRYARALFAIGVEKNSLESYGDELDSLATTYAGSADLRQVLENPVFRPDQKRALLESVLSRVAAGPVVRNFALLLLDRRRVVALPAIARALRELTDLQLGRVRATVTSARPLDATTLADVQRALERRTGKTVVVETAVDPTLIGGIVARVGDLLLDGSLRTQLETLRTRVLN